jgi:hypothetical protein
MVCLNDQCAQSRFSFFLLMRRTLKLEGNLFRQPTHGVLSKGADFVLKYLRDKIPAN